MLTTKKIHLPVWPRLAVLVAVTGGLLSGCAPATPSARPPGLSPAIQTMAAAQPPIRMINSTLPTAEAVPATEAPPTAAPTLVPPATEPSEVAAAGNGDPGGDGGLPIVPIFRSQTGRLRYDPQEWDATKVADGVEGWVYQLVHRAIAGCILQEDDGSPAPANWNREVSSVQIGGLDYQQEMWINPATRRKAMAVYQYPVGSLIRRFMVLMKATPGTCNIKAKEVLAQSADLVSAP